MRLGWLIGGVLVVGLTAGMLSQGGLYGPPQCHGTKELRGWHDKARLAEERGIEAYWNYELDHWIPLCLGGYDTANNLQFQPWAEAQRKDEDEWRLCEAVCAGTMTQQDAIRELGEKWRKEN